MFSISEDCFLAPFTITDTPKKKNLGFLFLFLFEGVECLRGNEWLQLTL